MRKLLARFGAGLGVDLGADHAAVFAAFAERLARLMKRRRGEARVRVVRG